MLHPRAQYRRIRTQVSLALLLAPPIASDVHLRYPVPRVQMAIFFEWTVCASRRASAESDIMLQPEGKLAAVCIDLF